MLTTTTRSSKTLHSWRESLFNHNRNDIGVLTERLAASRRINHETFLLPWMRDCVNAITPVWLPPPLLGSSIWFLHSVTHNKISKLLNNTGATTEFTSTLQWLPLFVGYLIQPCIYGRRNSLTPSTIHIPHTFTTMKV